MIGQPAGGAKYDSSRSISENLSLTSSTSRLQDFDLIFVIEDGLKKDEMADYVERELMTPSINVAASPSPLVCAASPRVPLTPASALGGTASRLKSKLAIHSSEFEPLPSKVFKEYLQYARSLPPPSISDELRGELDARFRSMQSTHDANSSEEGSCSDGRLLETLVRLCHARARLELSSVVTKEHLQDVWDLLLYCRSEHQLLLTGEGHRDMRGSQSAGGQPLNGRLYSILTMHFLSQSLQSPLLVNMVDHPVVVNLFVRCWHNVLTTAHTFAPPASVGSGWPPCSVRHCVKQRRWRKS